MGGGERNIRGRIQDLGGGARAHPKAYKSTHVATTVYTPVSCEHLVCLTLIGKVVNFAIPNFSTSYLTTTSSLSSQEGFRRVLQKGAFHEQHWLLRHMGGVQMHDLGCTLHEHVICTSFHSFKATGQATECTRFEFGGSLANVARANVA